MKPALKAIPLLHGPQERSSYDRRSGGRHQYPLPEVGGWGEEVAIVSVCQLVCFGDSNRMTILKASVVPADLNQV